MKKHKISRTEAMAILNAAPVRKIDSVVEPRSGLKAFQHKFDSEQESAKNAPLRAAQSEHSRLLKQLIDGDIATLYSAESQFLAATAPSIGDGSQFNGVAPEEIRSRIRRIFSEFEDSIAAEGQLTASGKAKLQSLARVNLSCDSTQVAFWSQAFYLLRAAGELGTDDFIAMQPVEQEQSANPLQEMLNAPNTREGERAARELGNASYWTGEAKEMFEQWERHILRDYNVVLDESQKRAVVRYFIDTNKSYLRHESWNEARRNLVKAGVLESHMITPDEALSQALESTKVPLDNRDARQNFMRRSRLINS